MYTHKLYIIENHTNMHVGSGEANFGLIDKLIQRDTITEYPIIHSSSLKGAIKEYCEYRHNPTEAKKFIDHIFGGDNSAGKVRFIDAFFLTIPMRSDTRPYYLCTSPEVIDHFLEISNLFNLKIPNEDELKKFASYNKEYIAISDQKATIEQFEAKQDDSLNFSALEKLIGSPAAIVPNKQFKDLLKDLPIVARNKLENGESKNLWYEEVMPRKSRFFTVISSPDYINEEDSSLKNHFNRLHKYLTDGETIHIGANASIGYGVCTFEEFSHA